MGQATAPITAPDIGQEEETRSKELPDRGYLVVCWNDPVNLMDYVTHVFQAVFGWPKAKARRHMLQVHEAGKSLLARETFEKAEHYVHQLQGYGLHATMEREEVPKGRIARAALLSSTSAGGKRRCSWPP